MSYIRISCCYSKSGAHEISECYGPEYPSMIETRKGTLTCFSWIRPFEDTLDLWCDYVILHGNLTSDLYTPLEKQDVVSVGTLKRFHNEIGLVVKCSHLVLTTNVSNACNLIGKTGILVASYKQLTTLYKVWFIAPESFVVTVHT